MWWWWRGGDQRCRCYHRSPLTPSHPHGPLTTPCAPLTTPHPTQVRTHLRNMVIIPEMIGSVVGVYNGKTFNQVEIKPDMIGHYLAEFSIS